MVEQKIIDHLSKDKILKKIIDTTTLEVNARDTDDVYYSLLRAICAQQLSSKAAATIFGRFMDLFDDGYPHPETLMDLDFQTLRGVGLSTQKTNYVQNVAEYFHENKLLNADWTILSDDDIIKQLSSIKGVGVWTVQMILIFSLGREDIFPIDDLAVKQGIMKLYQVDENLKSKALKKELTRIAEGWKPYRSYASRYLWQWR